MFLESLETVAIPDYGADHSAISKSMWEKIQSNHPDIQTHFFDSPIHIELAVELEGKCEPIKSNRRVHLDICITLPGSKLKVRIREVEFIILEAEMSEVLLGRPLLRSLGFDFKEHLQKMASKIDNRSVQEIENSKKKSKLSYQGLVYGEVDDDPIEHPAHMVSGFGKDEPETITSEFNRILREAKENGITKAGEERLTSILEKYRDSFRIKLGMDPPAKVEPLKIKPKKNAKPYRSPQRRYAPPQRAFISHTIKELENIGAVFKNRSARWASPALAVQKASTDSFRFTVDVRGPNSQTEPFQSSMPHSDSLTQDCAGSEFYANVDFCNGYWQLGLHKDSEEMMSIQTPLGIYTPTRVLQGGTDSGNHFQAVTREKFEGKTNCLLQWLDDFLLHAKSELGLIDEIENFLEVCKENGFKIHAKNLFLLERGHVLRPYYLQDRC